MGWDGFDEGSFTIGHTEERNAELVESIRAILDSRVLPPKEAEVLRGRLRWFDSYLFGRAPAMPCIPFLSGCKPRS